MTTADQNAAISSAILARVAAGADLPAAIDAVLGEGTFDAMARDVYDTLRSGNVFASAHRIRTAAATEAR
jgi:hypothetical protein